MVVPPLLVVVVVVPPVVLVTGHDTDLAWMTTPDPKLHPVLELGDGVGDGVDVFGIDFFGVVFTVAGVVRICPAAGVTTTIWRAATGVLPLLRRTVTVRVLPWVVTRVTVRVIWRR